MSTGTAASPSALQTALHAALRRRVPTSRVTAAALAQSVAALDLAALTSERHGELALAHAAALGDAAAVTSFGEY